MLKAALSGGYVNFGVLRLYGDDALENALGMFIKLLGSIDQKDIMVCSLSGKTSSSNSNVLFLLWKVMIT